MNPQSISTKQEASDARKEYINNLRLEVSNLQKVKNALDVLESTGQTISTPLDNRTQTEKYADLAEIKIVLQKKLMEIMDGENAIQTITELSRSPSELKYAVNRIDTLIPYFQGKYKLGTPYLVFLNYIRIKMRALGEEEKRSYGFSYTAKDSEQPTNPKVDKEKKTKKETKNGTKKETIPTPIEYPDDIFDTQPEIKKARNKKADERSLKKNETAKQKRDAQIKTKRGREPMVVDEIPPPQGQKRKRLDEDDSRKKPKLTPQGEKRKRSDEDGPRKKPRLNVVEGSGIETLNAKKQLLLDRLRTDNVKHLTVVGIKQKYTAKKIQGLKTERQIDKLYKKYKSSTETKEIKKKTGNIIFGEGLKVRNKTVAVDKEKAVLPKEVYSQFGRYLINNHRLNDDILMLRSKKGGAIPTLPTEKVSKSLIKAVSKIIEGKSIDYDDINQLNDQEKEHLGTIVSKSHLADQFKIPKTCQVDTENNRFEILKGEILAGNNSPSAIKEFKLLIVKLMNKNRLPRRQGTEILTDLTTLGF